jgi:NADH-quinone oxidoreductase subunit A
VLNEYFEDYIAVAVFLAVGFGLVLVAIAVSHVVAPSSPRNIFKQTAYESGIEPIGGGWNQSHIRYYIFALLFLIFDVEAVFILPWAVTIDAFKAAGQGTLVLVEMILFVLILFAGLVYAIRKGVLRWE